MSKVADVLAELRLEEERLTVELGRVRRAIEALEEAATLLGDDRVPEDDEPAPPAQTMPYAMLDLYSATYAYLQTVSEPQTARQIADALRAGGFKTRSRRFTATVRTMLRRDSARLARISVTRDHKRFYLRRK